MVEMLGVLAIVGVLSAGALKGYSAAMFKYKMNKTIDIFTHVLQRFAELEEKGIGGAITTNDFVKYGFLDECQYDVDLGCRLPIGWIDGEISDAGSFMHGTFGVYFTDSKSCIAFASADFGASSPIEWFVKPEDMSGGFIGIGSETVYDPYGNRGEPITKTPISLITQACQACDSRLCVYTFNIRHEI